MVISGNMNAGPADGEPAARAAAPPASRSQYQRANAITLISQMHPPMIRSSSAAVNLASVKIPSTSRTAADAVASVINPNISSVVTRSQRRCRSIRPGSPRTNTPRETEQKQRVDKPWEHPEVVGDEFLQDSHADHGGCHRPPPFALSAARCRCG